MRARTAAAVLLALAVAGCSVHANAAAPQAAVAERLIPSVVALRDSVQALVPPAAPPAEACAAETTALIVRWEIGSPARYQRLYQRPICPLCDRTPSGATIGLGFDLGHNTPSEIRRDWQAHPQVERLPPAAGYTGRAAIPVTAGMQDVVTPYRLAEQVFAEASLPAYAAATRRAYGPNVERLPCGARAALRSLTYNRGGAMAGPRNAEKRAIRDRCMPTLDTRCIAEQLRSMKRLWPDSRGLKERRDDEARHAEAST